MRSERGREGQFSRQIASASCVAEEMFIKTTSWIVRVDSFRPLKFAGQGMPRGAEKAARKVDTIGIFGIRKRVKPNTGRIVEVSLAAF